MGMRGDLVPGTATVTDAKRPRYAVKAKPGRWVVTIPGWHPTWTNKLIGCHRMKAHRLKQADAKRIADEAVVAGVTRATGRRRVGVVVQFDRSGRRPDPDNVNKSLRDAIAAAGLVVDDSAKWAEFTEPVIQNGKKATVITLEDI